MLIKQHSEILTKYDALRPLLDMLRSNFPQTMPLDTLSKLTCLKARRDQLLAQQEEMQTQYK